MDWILTQKYLRVRAHTHTHRYGNVRITTVIKYFSDFQAFGDLLMHTSGNNERYEHELECNKRCIMQLLFVLSGLYIF